MIIENCKIAETHLGFEDHGIFSVNVQFQGECWSQGTGHYFAQNDVERWIRGMLKVTGCEKWEDLPGEFVRVRRQSIGDRIEAVGNLLKDVWFEFSTEAMTK